MLWTVDTKTNGQYTIDDDRAWLWVLLERELGISFTQAQEKIANGSLEVITMLLYLASVLDGKTDLKMHQTWVEHEFVIFDVVADVDPKDIMLEASNDT